jgi:hypothetical protein
MDALDVATRTGLADDPAVVPALRFVVSKRLPDGRWPLEEARVTNRPLIASLLTDIEEAGQPGKWVTLTAMLLLRRCAAMVERIEAGEEFPGPPIAAPDGSFVPYPGDDGPADEERTRNEWAALPGMAAALDALVAFAGRQGLRTGWYRGLAIGPEDCREWCCAHAKLVPARTMRAAFPVARIGFIAPRGMFTVKGIGERLGGGPLHSLPTPVRPGSWVEKALWRVRVERWTPCWDAIGIAIRDKDELAPTLAIMADAVAAFRIVQGKQAAKTGENAR